ncbi:MAG: beta-lactamase family protein [Candidatus Eremiobacteraeota bacterium]|nr:beta-lactamase family protein [Candidatus Eremiobacteraeota bacterium]
MPSTDSSGFTITGSAASARYSALDQPMKSFMQQYGIRAGQLAVGTGGTVLFSHAYTNSADPSYMITLPTSIMRVSSISKAPVTAAITKLYASNTISPSTLVYPYLGVTKPLLPTQTPDPNANAITVQELVDHTAGLHDSSASAPEFNMYGIERAAGLNGPLTKDQFTAYLYGTPLSSVPGTQEVYSNDGYYLLARVIEKATGQNYINWIDANVLAPIGITDAVITATAASGRRPNEVLCDDPGTGPSVLTPQRATIVPDCYGGITYYEILDGPTSLSISAQSLVKYAGTYNTYGLGARQPGYAREGSFVGSISWMEALPDGNNFVFTFNRRVDHNGNVFDISPLTKYFEVNL